MRHGMKVAVAAGFVGAVAVAATAFGQTGTPSPTPGAREQRKLERRADQEQRKLERRAQSRNECGKAGPRASRAARRLVHSETKLQAKDGFVVVIADVGTITAVDAGAKTVTIERADGEDVTVTANDETKICKDGQKVTFDRLEVGDRAGINQVTKDGERRVRAIRAHSPQAESASPSRARPTAADEDLIEELSA